MNFKKEFPILENITYLDSAATSLKPISVINAITEFYSSYPLNSHSSDTPLAQTLISKINNTRELVAKLVKAKPTEVIFTGGTTDSINKLARMIEKKLTPSDEILVSKYNHNSNLIPWIELSKRTGSSIKVVEKIINNISSKTKLICVSQKNSAFGNEENLDEIYKMAQSNNALILNDAAQAIAIDKVTLSNSDFIVFSGNKIYGPTGIGALVIKEDILKTLKPPTWGGGATAFVKADLNYIIKKGVDGFEPGTPNSSGIVGLGAAIEFYNKTKELLSNVKILFLKLKAELIKNKNIDIKYANESGMVVFNYKNIPAQDVVSALAHKYNIYTRAGSFCNHLGMTEPNGSIRVSLGIYNTNEDIEKLIDALDKGDFFEYL